MPLLPQRIHAERPSQRNLCRPASMGVSTPVPPLAEGSTSTTRTRWEHYYSCLSFFPRSSRPKSAPLSTPSQMPTQQQKQEDVMSATLIQSLFDVTLNLKTHNALLSHTVTELRKEVDALRRERERDIREKEGTGKRLERIEEGVNWLRREVAGKKRGQREQTSGGSEDAVVSGI